jgi:glycosyltransferase involved in cell wall biosynthesis
MADDNMNITIFTPSYNRAHLLKRVYESLLKQTNTCFEWIIVDDGSTDATEQVCQSFLLEHNIPITYHRQENKGKHFAINQGVKMAKGDLILILDSDDALTNDAIQQIIKNAKEVIDNPNIAGIVGRKIYFDSKLIGNLIGTNIISNALNIRYQHKIGGDLAEVYKKEVLREFPFPEIDNEKFCAESLVWNRIALKYNLLYTDIPIYQVEYLPDGLSSEIVKIRMTSPITSMICYSELASYKIPFIQKVKAILNFWRFSFNSNWSFFKKVSRVNVVLSLFCIPLGYIMYHIDKRR